METGTISFQIMHTHDNISEKYLQFR